MQQMICSIDQETVLEYVAVADAVSDTKLMEICVKFLLESQNR